MGSNLTLPFCQLAKNKNWVIDNKDFGMLSKLFHSNFSFGLA
jgi:hypothetical protein